MQNIITNQNTVGKKSVYSVDNSANSLSSTTDGFKILKEIKIGDFVLTPSGEFAEVLEIFHNGAQEVFEITLESKKTIKCTAKHNFLCEDGQVRELFNIILQGKKIFARI